MPWTHLRERGDLLERRISGDVVYSVSAVRISDEVVRLLRNLSSTEVEYFFTYRPRTWYPITDSLEYSCRSSA